MTASKARMGTRLAGVLLAGMVLLGARPARVAAAEPEAAATDAAAEKAALAWLDLVWSDKLDESWAAAAPTLQERCSAECWRRHASSFEAALGSVESRKLVKTVHRTELPHMPNGDYVIFEFDSRFAEQKPLVEVVTMARVGDAWKVDGYWLRKPKP